jgi:hypothetical protein
MRSCGTCTLCCKVMSITELQKPKGQWCAHCTPGRGCQIYTAKPAECSTFKCGWLLDERLGDEWKPDKCKFVLSFDDQNNQLVAHVDSRFGTWRDEPYLSWLRNMAGAARPHGGMVLVVEQGKTILVYPERAIELGLVGEDDRIVMGIAKSNDGRERWVAQAVPRAKAEQMAAQLNGGRKPGML